MSSYERDETLREEVREEADNLGVVWYENPARRPQGLDG